MSIFVILQQLLFGPQKGACEVCGASGWKQTSIVDPCSPLLKILCDKHHNKRNPLCENCVVTLHEAPNQPPLYSCSVHLPPAYL